MDATTSGAYRSDDEREEGQLLLGGQVHHACGRRRREQANGLSTKHGMPASRNGFARSRWTLPSTASISMASTLPIMSAGLSTSGTPSFFIVAVYSGMRSGAIFDSPGQPIDDLRALDPLVLGDVHVVEPLGELDGVATCRSRGCRV